ncbi:hypothetical protein Tco_0332209 [Tanacetum coccineum]
MASFHSKDIHCYYHPCIDDPKKHYRFKPGLLGQSRSLGVDFSNMEMIENDWELESKEVSFLGRGLNSPVRTKEVEKCNDFLSRRGISFLRHSNIFEAYKLKTFLHNSSSNFPKPILGFGNKVYNSTSDRRKLKNLDVSLRSGLRERYVKSYPLHLDVLNSSVVVSIYIRGEWLKFNNRDFSLDSHKEFRKRLAEIRIKEIECLEGLDFEEFGALHGGISLQNLDQVFHVNYEQDDRRYVSQAWNRLFKIKEQVVREYVMEFLSSFTFKDHIEELDEADTMHSGKEKVTLDGLILLNSMDGGVSVDVPWHVAKFLCNKEKGSKRKSPIMGAHLIGRIASYYGLLTLGSLMNVTLGPETSSMSLAKLVNLGICRYNGLGIGEMVVGDDDVGAGQTEIGGVRRHPNMSNANRLKAMDERLEEIVKDFDELTYVVSGMSEQYDQFYEEFGQWRTKQERFISWNIDHLSQLLAHHHIDHTRYDRTHYSYVPSILDLGVQQGVNFMSGTPGYSTAPSPSASQFGMLGDAHPSTSRNQDDMNED